MYCATCGFKVDKQDIYCSNCGNKRKIQPVDFKYIERDTKNKYAFSSNFSFKKLFSGRLSRRNYWIMFIIINPINLILSSLVGPSDALSSIYGVWGIFFIILFVSMLIRRFHDVNLNGWWVLLGIIPIYLIVVLLSPPVEKNNKYGDYKDRSFDVKRILGFKSTEGEI